MDKPLYFVGDQSEGFSEIDRNLRERFVLRTSPACLSKEDCLGDYAIKNCSIDNIIVIDEAGSEDSEQIYQKENCIFISASFMNQTKYSDAFYLISLEFNDY